MNELAGETTTGDGVRIRAWEGFSLWITVFVIAGFAYQAIGPQGCDSGLSCDLRQIASYMLLSVLFFVGAAVWMRVFHRAGLGALGLRRPTRSAIWIGIGYGLGGRFAAMVADVATYRIVDAIRGTPPTTPEQIDLPATPSAVFWVGVALAVVAFAPIAEETLFRGLTYIGVRARGGPTMAIIVTSIFFAVTHIDPLLMPPLFVFAVILGRLRESRDDLVPVIVAHATFNAIGFAALYFQHVT